jgi:putative nucleotidyltransferase-like protein
VDGLSTQDELFAIRLLELARHVAPQGNRVKFVNSCEAAGIRSFLERFPELWERITDKPVREGILSKQEYTSRCIAYSLQSAAFQELVDSQLELSNIRRLWLAGLTLSHLLYGDISEREFQGLELLVSPHQVLTVQSILQELGFESAEPGSLKPGQQQAFLRWGHRRVLIHRQSGLKMTLSWHLYSPWIGSDLRGFEDLCSNAQELSREGLSDWSTLGSADTVLFLALRGFETGWSDMRHLLDLAVALEVLDYTWDQVRDLAGPRAVLLERAVEIVVRLLGVPHPQDLTFHYGDYEHALVTWTRWHRNQSPLRRELLSASSWSCQPTEALRRRLVALLTPQPDEIQAFALPPSLLFLYPAIHALRLLFRRRRL